MHIGSVYAYVNSWIYITVHYLLFIIHEGQSCSLVPVFLKINLVLYKIDFEFRVMEAAGLLLKK